DEIALGALVGLQRAAGDALMAARFEVAEDVRTTEAVDRLFGIADEEYRRTAVPVDMAKDAVLNRIGILEFVDQGSAVTAADGLGEALAVFRVQRGSQTVQQVVVADDLQRVLAPVQFGIAELDQARLEMLKPG